jgi:hypothetical protein
VTTGVVVHENVAVKAPAGIVTDFGTVTVDELLPIETEYPPAGALPVRERVPIAGLPPTT